MDNIRFVNENDISRILEIYAPYIQQSVVSFEYELPSLSTFRTRVEDIQKSYPYIVYEIDYIIVGYAYAHRYQERDAYKWNVELSIYVDKKYCKRGIGSSLMATMISLLKQQHIQNIHSCITIPNDKSIQLHKAFGFREVGVFMHSGYKDGLWLDVLWMEKTIGDLDTPQKVVNIHSISQAIIEEILVQHKKTRET
ncbi:MAG: N-acetyltransferase family protein [Longicatena sp.]